MAGAFVFSERLIPCSSRGRQIIPSITIFLEGRTRHGMAEGERRWTVSRRFWSRRLRLPLNPTFSPPLSPPSFSPHFSLARCETLVSFSCGTTAWRQLTMCILITTLSPGLVSSENGSVAEERADSTRNIGGKWRNGWVASLAPPGRGEGGQRFDGRYRNWSAAASINWGLENADSVDARRSSAGIMPVCEFVTRRRKPGIIVERGRKM